MQFLPDGQAQIFYAFIMHKQTHITTYFDTKARNEMDIVTY